MAASIDSETPSTDVPPDPAKCGIFFACELLVLGLTWVANKKGPEGPEGQNAGSRPSPVTMGPNGMLMHLFCTPENLTGLFSFRSAPATRSKTPR